MSQSKYEPIHKEIPFRVLDPDSICKDVVSKDQYRKSHYGYKTVTRPSHLYSEISCTDKTTFLYYEFQYKDSFQVQVFPLWR